MDLFVVCRLKFPALFKNEQLAVTFSLQIFAGHCECLFSVLQIIQIEKKVPMTHHSSVSNDNSVITTLKKCLEIASKFHTN